MTVNDLVRTWLALTLCYSEYSEYSEKSILNLTPSSVRDQSSAKNLKCSVQTGPSTGFEDRTEGRKERHQQQKELSGGSACRCDWTLLTEGLVPLPLFFNAPRQQIPFALPPLT